jgi:hypothetical protein
MGWMTGVRLRVLVGSRIFSSPHHPDQLCSSTQPPIQWIPGALSLGVKWLGHEADHSPPTNAEIKKMDLYIHSPIHLHDIGLN